MVSDDPPTESSAGSLTLIGGELALDFANTSSGRGWPTHREHLRSAADIADWAGHAPVLRPPDAEWLQEAARSGTEIGERLLEQALELREDIYLIGSEISAGRSAPADRIESLTRIHAHCLSRANLTPFGHRFAWTWAIRQTPIEAVLGPISLSAMTTLLQADLSRIKQCPGEKCGWLFFDATKNKSRRWCEMEVCGNRAKQRRFGAKARGV
jgi:predicted RNA-binding Zn ribbon-like protein